jgi:hypothetical protein
LSASRKDWSEAGFEGELKSMSNRMSLAPAWRSLSIRSACSVRGHGQTPISRIDGESIATRTMSPLAGRGNGQERKHKQACNKDVRLISLHATAPGRLLCAVRPSPRPRGGD